MSNINTTELINLDEIKILVPELLAKMQYSIEQAEKAVKSFPVITNNESKAKAFEFRSKIKNMLDTYYALRTPITRSLAEVTKKFTTKEAEGSALITHIDKMLNTYAQHELAEKRRIEEEAKQKQIKSQERHQHIAAARKVLDDRFFLLKRDGEKIVSKIYSETTEANLIPQKERLSKDPKWLKSDTITLEKKPSFIPSEYWDEVISLDFEGKKQNYLKFLKDTMSSACSTLDIFIADKIQAEKLRESETLRIAKEEEEEREANKKQIDAETALDGLDMMTDMASLEINVKSILKIEILENVGWLQCVSFWYENDPTVKNSDLSKKTFLQCKSFCEKIANSDGAIIEHPSIRYVEEAKAKK